MHDLLHQSADWPQRDTPEAPLPHGVGPFSDPALERDYRHDYFLRSLKPVRLALALALGLFVAFAFLDPFMVPDVLGRVLLVRFAVVVPVMAGLLLWTFTPGFEPHLQRAPVIALAVGGVAIIYITTSASPQASASYYVGILLAIAWGHTLSRLSFRAATLITLLLSGAYFLVELTLARMPETWLLTNLFFVGAANLMGALASYTFEAGFRRDFLQRRLLERRGHELQASVDRLHEAERHLNELERRAPQSLEHVSRWAGHIADELRRSLLATEVRVWQIVQGQLTPLNDGSSPAPSLAELPGPGQVSRDAHGNLVVPLVGLSGERFGAIVVTSPGSWDVPERRLVAGFARHLGGALELLDMRRELALAEERREEARRRMRARGASAMKLCPTCGRCYDESRDRCDIDGSPIILRLVPFRVQGRYQLVRLLGQGGMGQVFLARDERLQRDVAIKVLLSERLLDERERMQLAHEARAVARIGHAGVVEVYDLGELDDGSAFIVMEYLTGRSLADQIATHGRGTPGQVASLTRQVAAALAAAHRTGVVHRDLKPQNVFLLSTPDGITAKLLDFGVARVGLAEAVSISLGGRMFGTPAYMAPELIQGQAADARSDLYALAAVLFEALTGQRLVRPRGSVAAVLAAVLEEPLPNASAVVAGLPPRVDELFCWALSRDPAARPADLEAWAEELAALLEQVDGAQAAGEGWPQPITIEQPGARNRPAMVEVP